MKRLVSLILIVCLTLIGFSGCEATPALITLPSADEIAELKAARTETTADTAPTLCINGVEAIYTAEKNCYYWSVSSEEGWGAMTLTLTDEGSAGKTAVFARDFSGYTKTAFLRRNEAIPVIVYDETTYQLYNIKFSTLPLLSVQTQTLPDTYRYADQTDEEDEADPYATPSDDEDTPIGSDDVFASVYLLDTDAAAHGYDNGFTSMARIHVRGRSSREYPKNSYKLELLKEDENDPSLLVERNKTLLGMRSDGDWVLNGMYAEPTKVRDMVASQIWLAITADRETEGLSSGYQMEYCELFINGRYWGLYAMTERIDRKQLDLSENDRLYFSEGDVGKNYRDFERADTLATEISGYSLRFPKERTEPYDEWLPFAELTKLLESNKSTIREGATALIDLDSAVDYWLFIQTTTAYDNLIQNTFYVARQQEDGSYLFSFIPWDMDQTFGNRWTGEEPLFTSESYDSVDQILSFWVTNALISADVDDFKARVCERYLALRKTVLSDESLLAMVQNATDEVQGSGAFWRNQGRWREGGYQENLTDLRTYLTDHMAYLDEHIDTIMQ